MPINSCSINAFTLNGRTCHRRNLVWVPPVTPGGAFGTNNQSVSTTFARQRPDLVRHVEDDDVRPLSFEQPLITVQVTMDGVTMHHTLENVGRLDLVTVHDLVVTALPSIEAADVTVNISDIVIKLKT